MTVHRSLTSLIMVGALVAACGGGAATQGPGAATQGPGGAGGATQQPVATQDGGGNGGTEPTQDNGGDGGTGGNGSVDTSHGTGHIEIGAPVSKTIDIAFSPPLSHFGGTDETILYFLPTSGAEGALAITITQGELTAVFTSAQVTTSPTEACATSDVKVDALSASGSFDCPTNFAILASGASTGDVSVKGTFEAHG
ncbi:MAG TPA: hypothetical protein VFI15_08205 [Candidatus Limnocylindrales bacterium]|nr:hypothetical protein [Candidatus Limnocylindrales bacterium]